MSKKSIVLYLHVHQPHRIKPYSVFDMAHDHQYFDTINPSTDNQAIFLKVADKSYRPMNALLEKMLVTHPEFKLSLSITGTFIEQAAKWAPDVLAGFRRLVDSGRVEIVAETYHHSLAFFYSKREFERQVQLHTKLVQDVFGVTPTAIRNTELAYNNELAEWADAAGYKAILAEGWEPVLGWRSPNFVYRPSATDNIRLMLKNYKLSDDIAFRFSNKEWQEFPLTVDKYSTWADAATDNSDILNLFMDYETFGEHQWEETGIFDFMENFVSGWLKDLNHKFETVTGAALSYESKDFVDVQRTLTWADSERDLTAWTGNAMQQEALRYLYELEPAILHSNDEELIADWRNLQTSDHAYYMCTKWFSDGDVHAYFSPYESPYDAFLYFMNVIRDLRWRAMKNHHIGDYHG